VADTWTGAAEPNLSQSRTWTNGGNWSMGVVPPDGDSNSFSFFGDGTVTLDGDRRAQSMWFGDFTHTEIAPGQGAPNILDICWNIPGTIAMREGMRDTYGSDYFTLGPVFSCDIRLAENPLTISLGVAAHNDSSLMIRGTFFSDTGDSIDYDGYGAGTSLWIEGNTLPGGLQTVNVNNAGGGGQNGHTLHLADSGRIGSAQINLNSPESYLGLKDTGAQYAGGTWSNPIVFADEGNVFVDRSYQQNDLAASINRIEYINSTVSVGGTGVANFGSTGAFGRTNNGYMIEVERFAYDVSCWVNVNNGNLTQDRGGHRYVSGANRLQEAHNYTFFDDLLATPTRPFHKGGTGVLVVRQVNDGGAAWNASPQVNAGVLRLDAVSTVPTGGITLAPDGGVGIGWNATVNLLTPVPVAITPTNNIVGQSGALDIDMWGHTQPIDTHVIEPVSQLVTYLRVGSSMGGDASFDPQPLNTKHASTSGFIMPYMIGSEPIMYYFGGGGGTLVVDGVLWGSEGASPGPAGLEMGTTGTLLPGRVALKPEEAGEDTNNQYTGPTDIRAGTLQLLNAGAVANTSGVSLGTYNTGIFRGLYRFFPAGNPNGYTWEGPGQLLIDPDATGGMNLGGYAAGGGSTLGALLTLDGGVIGWTSNVNIDQIPGTYGATLNSNLVGPGPVNVLGLGGEYSAGVMAVQALGPGGGAFVIADADSPVLLYKCGINSVLDMTGGQPQHTYTGGTVIAGGGIKVSGASQLNAGSGDPGGPILILNGGILHVTGNTAFDVPIMVKTAGTPDLTRDTGSVIKVDHSAVVQLLRNFDFRWNPSAPLEKVGPGTLDYVAPAGSNTSANAWGLKLTGGQFITNQMPVGSADTGPVEFNNGDLRVASTVGGALTTDPIYGFRNIVSMQSTSSVVTVDDGGLFRTHGSVPSEILGTVTFLGNDLDSDVTNNVVHLSRNNGSGAIWPDASRGDGKLVFEDCVVYMTGGGGSLNVLPPEAGFTLELKDNVEFHASSQNQVSGAVHFNSSGPANPVRINGAETSFDRTTMTDDTWRINHTGTTTWSAGVVEKIATPMAPGAFGTVAINRSAGAPVVVAAGAKLKVSGGVLSAGGATDPFTDTVTVTRHVSVENNSAGDGVSGGFYITAGLKEIEILTGTGTTEVADGATLKIALPATVWAKANAQNSLVLNTSGTLDMTKNKIDDSGDTEVYLWNLVASSYNGGAWNQPGITSSSITDATHSVGVSDTYSGTPGVVRVGYTRSGDATMDLTVSLADFNVLFNNFGNPGMWDNADFNYSGTVTLADFNILFNNFGGTASGGGAEPLGTPVPEPASALVVLIGGAALMRRRRS
jgi:hypothetical protein